MYVRTSNSLDFMFWVATCIATKINAVMFTETVLSF